MATSSYPIYNGLQGNWQQQPQGALGSSISTMNTQIWAQGMQGIQQTPYLTMEEVLWLKKLFSYEPLRRKLLLMSKDGEIPDDVTP